MDVSAVVAPPHVARPFRLEPFRAMTLAARRIGDPASARALARPHDAAAVNLRRWEDQGQLTRDASPALYLHEYTSGGITIRGLVGGLDLSRRSTSPGDRAVFPHEGIHPAQVSELAERMAQMEVNPAPILLVHRGPERSRALLREARRRAPDQRFTDRAGQRHRIWALRDPGQHAELTEQLRDVRALIADGHHRYGAYLRLQEERPGSAADQGLAMLVDHDDTPLFLGAIHRVLAGTTLDDLAAAARAVGLALDVRDRHCAVDALGPGTIVATDGRRWAAVDLGPADRLAVEALHLDLVPALPTCPSRIGHHHSAEAAIAQVGRGAGVAVLLPAPDVDAVLEVVARGRLLPEKATSFQPKPNPGVLIRSTRAG